MQYRREIDGLRAIAVGVVILFHAGLMGAAEGGYVGVDVFFVLSGYLITGILLEEVARGHIDIAGFYERRARRILPALIVVCMVTVPLGWALLLPFEFEAHFKALGAVALFISNFHFADQGGYFAPGADVQPLLHTWSLAVEEQFYLLFPLILVPLARRGVRWLFIGLSGLTMASFGLSVWGSVFEPEKNFFFTLSRFWELLAGALCAVILRGRQAWARDGLAASGLGMIALAVIVLGHDTPAPSAATLLPVGGTVLLILFAGEGGRVARLLGWRPLVGLGLISYSAYLWHQPVLVFARLWLDHPPGPALLWALVALILGLAAATWALIEQPFRRRGKDRLLARRAQVFAASGLGLGLLLTTGLWGWKSDGGLGRFAPATQELLRDYGDFRRTMGVFDLGRCFTDLDQGHEVAVRAGCIDRHAPGDLVLWGDSMAAHLVHGLRKVAGRGVTQFTAASCRPFAVAGATERCRATRAAFHAAKGLTGTELVLSANWFGTAEDLGNAALVDALRAEVRLLRAAGFRVMVVGQTPDFPTHAWVRRLARLEAVPEVLRVAARSHHDLNSVLATAVRAEGAAFFDPGPALCDLADGQAHCLAVNDFRPIYADAGHLSAEGSDLLARALQSAGFAISTAATTP